MKQQNDTKALLISQKVLDYLANNFGSETSLDTFILGLEYALSYQICTLCSMIALQNDLISEQEKNIIDNVIENSTSLLKSLIELNYGFVKDSIESNIRLNEESRWKN